MSQPFPTDMDTRVLKDDYCNYDLIARCWNDEYRGVVWKNKVRVANCDGLDLDEIMDELRAIVDQLQADKRKARGRKKISAEDLASAIQGIEHKLSRAQKMMLVVHNRAPANTLSVKGLSRLGDYSNPEDAFADYAAIARRLSDELAFSPKLKNKTAYPDITLLFEEEVCQGAVTLETTMTLNQDMIAALSILGW